MCYVMFIHVKNKYLYNIIYEQVVIVAHSHVMHIQPNELYYYIYYNYYYCVYVM